MTKAWSVSVLWMVLLGAGGLPAGLAAPQPFPGFWPAGCPLQIEGYDQWRVLLTRCEVRRTPTTVHNLLARRATMNMWLGELARRKVPVDAVAPRARLAQLAALIDARDSAAACREVDAIFRGLEAAVAGADTMGAPGVIVGLVVDQVGAPVADAAVTIAGTPLGGYSDDRGRVRITDVPCAAPRYVVRAHKAGHLDGYAGGVAPTPEHPGEAIVLIEKVTTENGYRAGALAVRVARLVEVKQAVEPALPLGAATLDMRSYPPEVQPYLQPAGGIDSAHRAVRTQAETILAAVAEADRMQTTAIAKAVYGWIVQNIAHDVPRNYPDDPTSGGWQLTNGAWGANLDEWCAKPSEVLVRRRAVGLEYERLATALLRALHIPARPALVGTETVCQWWVQLPAGNGYWTNMQTASGRDEYVRSGNLQAHLPAVGDDQIAAYSPDERAPVPVTWDAARPCLWLLDYGERGVVAHSPPGLAAARRVLDQFSEQGRIPRGARQEPWPTRRRSQPAYEIASHGVVIDLASLAAQRKLTIRFPMYLSNQYRGTIDARHWTNHPEWIKSVRKETDKREVTKEAVEWYCIDLELGSQAAVPETAVPVATPPAH